MPERTSTAPAEARAGRTGHAGTTLSRILWLVALYAAAVYLPFLGSGRTLTRHEVFITQPALQMLSDGNWLVPHYTDRVWIQKPPLISWLTAGLFHVTGGFHEWASRLPAALSAIGLCLVVAGLASRFYGPAAGLLAGLVQATSVYGYIQGRLGEVDMTFVFLLAAAQAVLAWHWGNGSYRLPLRAAVLFHVLAGLAMMTKGPLAVALLGGTVLTFCAIRRSLQPLRAVLWTPAIFAFLAVALPWYVTLAMRLDPANLRTWYYDTIGRASGEHHLAASPFYFYLYTVPWLMLPWTIVLLLGAKQLYSTLRQPKALFERFLCCWFLAGLVLLSLSAFKHMHYCMPILPPLSILAGTLLAEHAAHIGHRARRIYGIGFALGLVAFAIVSGIVMPRQDGRRLSVAFLRQSIPQVPADVPLYVTGLGQSAAYPYIQHPCSYLDPFQDLRALVIRNTSRSIWMLTLRGNIPFAEENGLTFRIIAGEEPRKKLPAEETLVLGRLSAPADPPADVP
jgi:4-amino-4-deoxy-L-arabinose transferase-like glycosyltransferase